MDGTVDYWAKAALACRGATTQTGVDMIAAFEQAITSTEALLGKPLFSDCVDAAIGEVEPLVIATNNGPAMRSTVVVRWFRARPHLKRVTTRHEASETNGVIELGSSR